MGIKTHGESRTKLYRTWFDMRRRCNQPQNKYYKNYGGRGIKVCREWEESYENFSKWAHSNGYSDDLTIDRIDRDLGYCPENCRWVDQITQANNRTNNHMITYNGETLSMKDTARKYGISYSALRSSIQKGKDEEVAVRELLRKENVKRHLFRSRKEWLEARKGTLGGSDIASVVGMNPWRNNVELWEEMVGIKKPNDISEKAEVQYGIKAEDPIRKLFRLDHPEMVVTYKENNLWTNSKYPFAHASLDGELVEKESGRKGILEIKTTNILQSMQREKWNDRIPDSYYCQCLWYLAVTESDFIILRAQLKSVWDKEIRLQTREYRIEREDVQEDIDYLMDKAEKFMKFVETKTRPGLVINF